jgi:hypothetical protein
MTAGAPAGTGAPTGTPAGPRAVAGAPGSEVAASTPGAEPGSYCSPRHTLIVLLCHFKSRETTRVNKALDHMVGSVCQAAIARHVLDSQYAI